jgi:hypothetical protein
MVTRPPCLPDCSGCATSPVTSPSPVAVEDCAATAPLPLMVGFSTTPSPATVDDWATGAPLPVELDAPTPTTAAACAAGAPVPVDPDRPTPAAVAACTAGAPLPVDPDTPAPAAVAAWAVGVPLPADNDRPAPLAVAACAPGVPLPLIDGVPASPSPVTVEACATAAPLPVDSDSPAPLAVAACALGVPVPVELDTPVPLAVAACDAGAPVAAIPNVTFADSSAHGQRSVVSAEVNAKSAPVSPIRICITSLAGVTPCMPISNTMRSPAAAAVLVTATALNMRVAALAISGNSVPVVMLDASTALCTPASETSRSWYARCASPLVVVSAHLPMTIENVPLMVSAVCICSDTNVAYRVCDVAVAPNTADSVVSAVLAFVVRILRATYAPEFRSQPPSPMTGSNGAAPVLWR